MIEVVLPPEVRIEYVKPLTDNACKANYRVVDYNRVFITESQVMVFDFETLTLFVTPRIKNKIHCDGFEENGNETARRTS